MIPKEREQFLEKLHKSILDSPNKISKMLLDSSQYKKVQTENNQFKFLRPEDPLPHKSRFRSSIIESSQENLEFIQSLFTYRILYIERIFNAKKHGFSAAEFHRCCDGKKPTLILCKTLFSNQIFGAFSSIAWEGPSVPQYKTDRSSFLFSFTKKTKHSIYQNEIYAVLMDKNAGPCFGGGSDLRILDGNEGNASNLGFTFELSAGEGYDTKETWMYLAGDLYFTLDDYEVFLIDFHPF